MGEYTIENKPWMIVVAGVIAGSLLTGCGGGSSSELAEIKIDGSSTAFPITEVIVEEFNSVNPDIRIPIGISGTGGGIQKFIGGEVDIVNASRALKDNEIGDLQSRNIGYEEFTVAYDGLSVLVNPQNTWVDYFTVDELAAIWGPGSTVTNWSDVRTEWPDEPITLYAPGTDSGTFDYFTEEINGESGAIRSDFTASEDDNVLVQGVAGDRNALGFFGYAYYDQNREQLRAVPIDGGNGPVEPTIDTIKSLEYTPLSRPIYIYVTQEALTREEVKSFVRFYLEKGNEFIPIVGYIPLPAEDYLSQLSVLE